MTNTAKPMWATKWESSTGGLRTIEIHSEEYGLICELECHYGEEVGFYWMEKGSFPYSELKRALALAELEENMEYLRGGITRKEYNERVRKTALEAF